MPRASRAFFPLFVLCAGTTVRSCSIRLVLGSVCWQVAMVYNRNTSKIPGDYPSLVTYFKDVLQVGPDRCMCPE
jgi:hypothetical protein